MLGVTYYFLSHQCCFWCLFFSSRLSLANIFSVLGLAKLKEKLFKLILLIISLKPGAGRELLMQPQFNPGVYLNTEELLIYSTTNHCHMTDTGSSCFIFCVWQVSPLCILQCSVFFLFVKHTDKRNISFNVSEHVLCCFPLLNDIIGLFFA